MASLLRRGLAEEGHAVDVARTGDDALWMAGAAEYDAIVLDLMLPGVDGIEVCRRVRESGVWAPGPHAHRARRRRRPRSRPRCRRRRLSRQAVLVRRAARPAARARPSRAASNDPLCSRSATFASTRRRGRSGAGRPRSPSRRRSSRCSRRSCDGRDRSCPATSSWNMHGTTRTRIARTSSTCTSGTCATRSTVRSAATRSRPCAAPGIASGRRSGT